MKEKKLKFILEEGEGYNIEFKEAFSSEIAKDICAFANANGGRILLGISDKKEINGIEITNRLKSQIHDLVRNFDPKLKVSLEEFNRVLVINVPEGKDKPYSTSGKFYSRQGTNSQRLSRDEIIEFFYKEGRILFDETVNSKFDFNVDFNKKIFKLFLKKANISQVIKREDILSNLELIEDGKLKNAGVLLFCKKVTRFFMNATITCILAQGKNKVKILDRVEFDGDIYSNYENAIEYIKSKLNTEYIIRTAGPREEKLELPEEAIREALLNAICHRNYFMESSIFIEIYSDRLEIINPGGLVPGITLKELGKKSLSRNKLLFGLMQRMDLIEKAGTGILRIRTAMKDYKLILPKIETDENWFSIIFKRPDLQKESYEQRFYGKIENVPGNVPGNVPENRLDKILRLMEKNSKIAIPEIAKQLKVNEKTIKRDIEKLKEKGVLKRIGPDKGGYWKVVET